MIKSQNGHTNFTGEAGAIIADFMSICDTFISYIEGEFEVNEAKAIDGLSHITDIVKEDHNKHDEKKLKKQLHEFLDYITEDKIKQRSESAKATVIKVDSLEEALEKLGDILENIAETGR